MTSVQAEKKVFWGEWSGLEGMRQDFKTDHYDAARHEYVEDSDQVPEGIEVLLAIYDLPSYEGQAFVLYRQDGKLFEVNGSHCSCYGLEGQWEPEEANLEELAHRLPYMFSEPQYAGDPDAVAGAAAALKAIIEEELHVKQAS